MADVAAQCELRLKEAKEGQFRKRDGLSEGGERRWAGGGGRRAHRISGPAPLALINFSIRVSVSPTLRSTQRVLSSPSAPPLLVQDQLLPVCRTNDRVCCCGRRKPLPLRGLTPRNCPIFRPRLAEKCPKRRSGYVTMRYLQQQSRN